ncbi:MAG: ATP-binding cassette domain-containing protein, partial [Chloroflexi bacterium]|nr:ATP-binding cassette domain-containing protein [Chloroflexota bacterium]
MATAGQVQANSADVSIEVSGVSKFFGELAAVNDLTFSVKKGEVVGFLGPNGSGKTTTMRMLTSFYTPDVGGINIDGLDTKDHDIATRERIGYLPENNPVYADLLVSEYLDFVADLRGLTKQGRRENIAQTIEETGLQDVYMRPIGQLSKGYKQRVGLAQA